MKFTKSPIAAPRAIFSGGSLSLVTLFNFLTSMLKRLFILKTSLYELDYLALSYIL